MKYFTKTAVLKLDDIEDELGTYLSDPLEAQARNAIEVQKAKRFPMRHPWLTGIPTLGIAPAVSNNAAKNEIVRNLARNNVQMRNLYINTKRRREQNDLERYKADSGRRTMQTAGLYGMGVASVLSDKK